MRSVARAGAQPDFVCMGGAASDAFETNPHVMDGYNRYWIRPGELNPKERDWGVTVLGSHRGITLYSYGSTYEDDMTRSYDSLYSRQCCDISGDWSRDRNTSTCWHRKWRLTEEEGLVCSKVIESGRLTLNRKLDIFAALANLRRFHLIRERK